MVDIEKEQMKISTIDALNGLDDFSEVTDCYYFYLRAYARRRVGSFTHPPIPPVMINPGKLTHNCPSHSQALQGSIDLPQP